MRTRVRRRGREFSTLALVNDDQKFVVPKHFFQLQMFVVPKHFCTKRSYGTTNTPPFFFSTLFPDSRISWPGGSGPAGARTHARPPCPCPPLPAAGPTALASPGLPGEPAE